MQADEIHLCGEAGAISLVEEICNITGEELEVKKLFFKLISHLIFTQNLNLIKNSLNLLILYISG